MSTSDFNPLQDGEYTEALIQNSNLQPPFSASWSYLVPLIIAGIAIIVILWLKLRKK